MFDRKIKLRNKKIIFVHLTITIIIISLSGRCIFLLNMTQVDNFSHHLASLEFFLNLIQHDRMPVSFVLSQTTLINDDLAS